MKRIFFIVAFLLSFSPLKAEYEGWIYQFTIETYDGREIEGYKFVDDNYGIPDNELVDRKNIDEETKNYLKRFLMYNYDKDDDNHLYYYRYQIDYKMQYVDSEYPEEEIFYTLVDEANIDLSEIKKINIDGQIRSKSYEWIINDLTYTDREWMETKVLKNEYVNTTAFCGYSFFFHEMMNPKLKKLMNRLNRKIETLEHFGSDSSLDPIFKQITKYKVIIIASCMC